MTKIDTLYLDMDGVLSDFMSKFREVNGDWKRDHEGKKSDGWKTFCEGRHFASLDTWPGAPELLQFVGGLDINVEILTSTGGAEFHEMVREDKISWCEDHGIFYKVNAVPGRWTKKEWARPTAILVDDTKDVIDEWIQNGGIGILHRDVDETIDCLKKLLDSRVQVIYNEVP